ncbi:phosphotransferase [Streptomyces sp. NPDC056405]|uniref:phosphotransferase n=1 Tax=Streptomyces sp. NPDC056405 TaxID=3345811 RepID=UPI0035D8D99B
MATERTPDRPSIDTSLVGRLVDRQFPQWAELPLRPLEQAGSDHVIHRLGEELTVRLPRHAGAIGQARKELEWLPRLAPHLPLAVPVPVAVGEPALGYPWPWAVTRWLDGEVATVETLADSSEAARELADFLTALQRFVPGAASGLGAGEDLTVGPLAARDEATRAAIAEVGDVFDTAATTELWDAALSARWALATGLNAYASYAAVNARVAAQTTRQITQALVG